MTFEEWFEEKVNSKHLPVEKGDWLGGEMMACKHKKVYYHKNEGHWICHKCNKFFKRRQDAFPKDPKAKKCTACGTASMADAIETPKGLYCLNCFADKVNGTANGAGHKTGQSAVKRRACIVSQKK